MDGSECCIVEVPLGENSGSSSGSPCGIPSLNGSDSNVNAHELSVAHII
jgi:hypothetical protein